MGKVKVTLDTNILLSITLKKTLAREFSKLCNTVDFYSSEEILRELARVLTYPKIEKILKEIGIDEKIALEAVSKRLKIVKSNIKINKIKIDPSDNKILECAISSKSIYIVSRDNHLLNLRKFDDIRILTAREFLDKIKIIL